MVVLLCILLLEKVDVNMKYAYKNEISMNKILLDNVNIRKQLMKIGNITIGYINKAFK